MNNEEKILEILEKLNSRMENLESGQVALEGYLERIKSDQSFTNLRLGNLEHKQAAFEGRMARFESALGGMQEDIAGLKDGQAQMQEDIAGLKDGQAQMQEDIAGLKYGQTQMQDDLTAIKVRLDYDVDVRLKAISEDIDVIKTKLETLDEVKELAEKTADKVDVIHAVVTQHSAAITELKKVQ